MKRILLVIFTLVLLMGMTAVNEVIAGEVFIDFEDVEPGPMPTAYSGFEFRGDSKTPVDIYEPSDFEAYSGTQVLRMRDDSTAVSAVVRQRLANPNEGRFSAAFYQPSSVEKNVMYFTLRLAGMRILDIQISNQGDVNYRDISGLNTVANLEEDSWHTIEVSWNAGDSEYTLIINDEELGVFPLLINGAAPNQFDIKVGLDAETDILAYIDDVFVSGLE